MPVLALPPKRASYVLLEAALPGRPPIPAGVLLLDEESDRLFLRLRDDWEQWAPPEDAEVFSLLAEDLAEQARELGAAELLRLLEDRLSNALRLSERRAAVVADFARAVQRLFEREVAGRAEPARIVPFVTHVPVYALRAAAGKFGPDQEVDAEPEDWIPAPAGWPALEDYFVCHVTGRSMEPRIPDGSLCLFRRIPAGSRQGKLVLVRHRSESQTGGEFTVKRYRSEKIEDQGEWRHTRIVLEPLNPEFPVLELGPEEFQVIGEFVRVIPVEET